MLKNKVLYIRLARQPTTMKKLTTLLLLLAAFSPLFAQITLTSADMPAPPTVLYNGVDTMPSGASLGQNGANRTWDFSALARHRTDTVNHKLPSATPYPTTYTGATDGVTLNNVNYAFFKNSSTKYECLGLAGDLLSNGSSIDVTFNPVLQVYQFPMAYGNRFSDSYGFVKQVSGSSVGQPLANQVKLTFTATFYDTIDAWGALTTPIGTYQTIREKRIEYNRTKVDVLPFFPATWSTFSDSYDTIITYTWLSTITKGPVLTATVSKATGNITNITYSLTPPPVVAPVANFTWANPYGGFVQFTNTSTNNPTTYAWTYGDGGTSNAASPNHTYAANGTYNVCLTVTNAGGSNTYCANVTVSGIFNTVINGPAQRCSNQRTGVAYTATSRAGNTYSWTATGGSLASGAGTAAITVNWNANGPYNLRLIECNSTGQFCDTADLAVTILPAPTTTVTQTICYGQSYLGYTASGTYPDTYTAANGCDSVRTLVLTVRPQNTTTVNITVCAGGSYHGYTASGSYTDQFTDVNGCDSVRTLNLTVRAANITTVNASICPGSSYYGYTTSGTYTDPFTDINGCDSIRTLNLTVQASIVDTLNLSICNGNSYFGYTVSGSYNDTFTVSGCDSVRVLNLSVLNEILDTVSALICAGDTLYGYFSTGVYIDTFTSVGGCDSIRTLYLATLQPVVTNINQTICYGDSYLGYTASGTYSTTYVGSNGCDSVRNLTLTVRPQNVASVSASICFGDDYDGYTTAGIYTDTLIDGNGCDYIRTLNLNILPAIATSIAQTICSGQSFEGYTIGGVYSDTFAALNGCDSIRELTLSVLPVMTNTEVQTICDGESYNGFTATGVYIDTFSGSNGCDSLQVLDLTVAALPAVPVMSIVGNMLSVDDNYSSYQWYQDTTLLVGDTSDVYTATVNGNYSVLVTNSAGCQVISATQNVTGIGVNETVTSFGVKVYPNPTAGKVYMDVEGIGEAKWTLFNAVGQHIKMGTADNNTAIIDMGEYTEGCYFVRVQSGDNLVIVKIFKSQ